MRLLSFVALLIAFTVSGCDSVNYTPVSDVAPAAGSDATLSKGQSVSVGILPCGSGTTDFIVDLAWKPGGATAVLDMKADFGGGAVSPSILAPNLADRSARGYFIGVTSGVTNVEVTEVSIEFRDGAKINTYTSTDGQIQNNTATCTGG